MLIVANARVFGGGFKIAPRADLEDGQLDVVGFSNMGLGAAAAHHGPAAPGHARGGAARS